MSKRLPYEEYLQQQWTDLPLPDEDPAWADMKRRLDEDDDNGTIVWWRRGCLGWGILLLLLLSIGWWLFKPLNWFSNKTNEQIVTEQPGIDSAGVQRHSSKNRMDTFEVKKDNVFSDEAIADSILITEQVVPIAKGSTTYEENRTVRIAQEPFSKQTGTNHITTTTRKATGNKLTKAKDRRTTAEEIPVSKTKKITTDLPGKDTTSASVSSTAPIIRIDSLAVKTTKDTLVKKTSAVDTALTKAVQQTRKEKEKDKNVFFSAGLGMHQQLPVAGQKLTPYNSFGRKGSLMDYIPSLYFRLNKANKWFIHSEFRYGAPQYNKEFIYNQKIELDSFGRPTTSSKRLKKTFYHQVPLTFNYYVIPNLSIGAGLVWNKFSSAVFDEEVKVTNTGTDSLLSSGIFRGKNEKEFSSSYFQGILETQYKWKRFSIGGRYAFGLQPYIKFTLPGGTQQAERNQSVQVFLRYEFWKSK